MFTFPDVLHLFPNEFSGLRRRGLALTFVFPKCFERPFFRHSEPPAGSFCKLLAARCRERWNLRPVVA